eukprot:scaffold355_cov211-Pinguiococcus_pyrenoidosus.AAC.2
MYVCAPHTERQASCFAYCRRPISRYKAERKMRMLDLRAPDRVDAFLETSLRSQEIRRREQSREATAESRTRRRPPSAMILEKQAIPEAWDSTCRNVTPPMLWRRRMCVT